MTKDLRKQICEKCGIEPLNNENAYFTGKLGLLPDFGQPENFVKLLELPVKYHDGSTWTLCNILVNYDRFHTRKGFLDSLLKLLEYYEMFYIKEFEAITKSIREAEWKYE